MMQNKIINEILDFVLPRFCHNCNVKLDQHENVLCRHCFASIEIARDDFVQYEFRRKFESDKLVDDFFAHFIFEKSEVLQELIHELKYSKQFQIGIFLGEILGKVISNKKYDWQIDEIIPVPLHRLKKAERGFNQSYYISKGINKILLKDINTKLLKRIRYTETQTNKNLESRKDNMRSAFKITNSDYAAGKNFLLVDDVITTGATISECAKILKENGAANVYAASVAIADF